MASEDEAEVVVAMAVTREIPQVVLACPWVGADVPPITTVLVMAAIVGITPTTGLPTSIE